MINPNVTCPCGSADLDARVAALEAACTAGWPVDVARFAPPPDDPARLSVLCELLRVELECGWGRGTPPLVDDYRRRFPDLFAHPDLAAAVEFENDRLRAQTPPPTLASPTATGAPSVLGPADTPSVPFSVVREPTDDGRGQLPTAGEQFLGFHLIEELGAGAFGRVFLARQKALSDRPVALKLTTRLDAEAQFLARLQHTNIMPVLSVHSKDGVHAVCMPFHGRTTLGHILRVLHRQHSPPAFGRSLVSELRGSSLAPPTVASARPDAPPADARPEPGSAAPARDMLARMRFADAVVWIGARLADGLAHAHERGVLHRDLKPDNVLVADDGQPMLLDFNLADDFTRPPPPNRTGMGGTLRYMAPEHLAAFVGDRAARVDGRSDLYALGLMLYELLAGRHPFPVPPGLSAAGDVLLAMRLSRQKRPDSVRRWNRAVPAAVDEAVCKLLDPDPARRYQTARSVEEDLDRHLAHLPLRYAREPVGSRVRKWVRRNPKAMPLLLLIPALCAVAGLATVTAVQWHARVSDEAAAGREQFRTDLREGQILLAATTGDPVARTAGVERLRAALARYVVLDDPDWHTRPAVTRLPTAVQAGLRADVGEALLLLARATSAEDPAGAVRLNRRAEEQFPPGEVPLAVWRQRFELCERLGDTDAAAVARRWEGLRGAESAQAAYLDGSDRAVAGRFAEAISPLEEACRLDPSHPAATFTLGFCYDAVGRDPDALECYRACIALRPEAPWAYLNRGLVYLRQGDDRRSMTDLNAAVRLQPDWADAVFTRGTLHHRAGRWAEAVADYERAETLGCKRSRLFLLRSQCKHQLNDPTAGDDRANGFATPPADEHDHVARGVALMETFPERAVGEFDRALSLNPRSLSALQNKAHVLVEHLYDTEAAVAVLDRVVELYPAYVPARAGRGVYSARLGKREAAQRDAVACLRRDTSPATLYQLAGVYAHTARKYPDDLREAIRLLGAAFTAGFHDFDTVDADPDLDPIRSTPQFSAVVNEFRPPPARREN